MGETIEVRTALYSVEVFSIEVVSVDNEEKAVRVWFL